MVALCCFCLTDSTLKFQLDPNEVEKSFLMTSCSSLIQVLGLQLAQGNQGQGAIEITPDEEERFNQLAKDPDIRNMIFKSIAPATSGCALADSSSFIQ